MAKFTQGVGESAHHGRLWAGPGGTQPSPRGPGGPSQSGCVAGLTGALGSSRCVTDAGTLLPGTGRARTARCTALPGWGREDVHGCQPQQEHPPGTPFCALWHLWLDLVKRSESELGEELLMVTELGMGGKRTPAVGSLAALSAPSQSLQARSVSFANPPARRRVWRTVDSRVPVDAY